MTEPVLRAAAFGTCVAVEPALLAAPPHLPARSRLLAAIVHGARGDYAAAAAILAVLRTGTDPVLAALACATLASHRRQLGGHAAALALDATAVALAKGAAGDTLADPDGLDRQGALCDGLLGLAADNLGLGRLGAARRLLAAAGEVRTGWRGRVRAGWVGAEIELASGRPAAAIAPAEAAAGLALASAATRHRAKSDLVLAAALAGAGEPARAAELVAAALEVIRRHGLRSLDWPACLLAAGIAPIDSGQAQDYRFRARQTLHTVLLRSDPVGRRLAKGSPWMPV